MIFFDVIPDYRQQDKVDHKLIVIIPLIICAVLSGQDDWKAIRVHACRQGKFTYMPMFKGFVTY
ncbi:transposase family protein [Vibrio aestuarianus]|uniref:transposase family protein n=1 Tax=Vibrio aestuarianus TaxID=28171 RepID=UPI00237D25B1|nr:transposase family protein [Vibrio aestuarianus]